MKIEALKKEHWQEVKNIFVEKLLTKKATFIIENKISEGEN